MKKIKGLFGVVFALVLAFGLFACAGNKKELTIEEAQARIQELNKEFIQVTTDPKNITDKEFMQKVEDFKKKIDKLEAGTSENPSEAQLKENLNKLVNAYEDFLKDIKK